MTDEARSVKVGIATVSFASRKRIPPAWPEDSTHCGDSEVGGKEARRNSPFGGQADVGTIQCHGADRRKTMERSRSKIADKC